MKSKLVIATFSSGSTYFQRSATVWLRELVDPAFTNPHELLNGLDHHEDGYLIKEWSDVNAQSVTEIRRILEHNHRPIVARLSYDHVLLRNETPQELADFYAFLREYFDVYVSRRDNLFDYGLCWAIRRCTDREPQHQINNVHTPEDRTRLYEQHQFTVDASLVPVQAQKYLQYLDWVDQHFPDAVPVLYRDLERDIDTLLNQYFPAEQTFAQKHGMSIRDFTRVGYALSMRDQTVSVDHIQQWQSINAMLQDLCERKILLDSIPIKSTTMQDKVNKVANFSECIQVYNKWAQQSSRAIRPITSEWIQYLISQDQALYRL